VKSFDPWSRSHRASSGPNECVVPPPGRHDVTPSAGHRELVRCGERLPVRLADQRLGPHVDQPGTRPRHGHEIGRVHPGSGRGPEPQPQRLGDDIDQASREVQREQQPGLLQALEPVVTARADHELQAGPVPLTSPPGKPADRAALLARRAGQLPHRARHRLAVDLPRHQPAVWPALAQVQPGGICRRHPGQQLVPAGPVRPQRAAPAGLVSHPSKQNAPAAPLRVYRRTGDRMPENFALVPTSVRKRCQLS
jgi:hypothetical protein